MENVIITINGEKYFEGSFKVELDPKFDNDGNLISVQGDLGNKIYGRGDIYIDNLPNYSGFVDLKNPKIFRGIFEAGKVIAYQKYESKIKKFDTLEITVDKKVIYWGEININLYADIVNDKDNNELYVNKEYIIDDIILGYCNKSEKSKYNFSEIKPKLKNEKIIIPFQGLMIKGSCCSKLNLNRGCVLEENFITDIRVENGAIKGYKFRKKIQNDFTYEYSGDVNENYNLIWEKSGSILNIFHHDVRIMRLEGEFTYSQQKICGGDNLTSNIYAKTLYFFGTIYDYCNQKALVNVFIRMVEYDKTGLYVEGFTNNNDDGEIHDLNKDGNLNRCIYKGMIFNGEESQNNENNNLLDNGQQTNIGLNWFVGIVGLDGVKKSLKSLEDLMIYRTIRPELNEFSKSMHMVFVGNPGTGKTTFARILGRMLKDIGFLEKGHVIEVDRNDLVAMYVGQTENKTKAKIEDAMGGILFIDEAYTLFQEESPTDFGKESIDCLCKIMEDKRDKFVVIVAGYPELMVKFLNSNPGLKSRFTEKFIFEDYNQEEKIEIFQNIANKNKITFDNKTRDLIKEQMQFLHEAYGNGFANARGVRNYFETIIRDCLVPRIFKNMDSKSINEKREYAQKIKGHKQTYIIIKEDVNNATQKMKKRLGNKNSNHKEDILKVIK
ncbi:AAA family ATPase [Clostridium lacusfryxellense]|uniref:AAA family ATPase n=1 Tax=Clostridium lacusfryxellense TaxID=205328 RepID=UPI001C0B8CAD|nr:AAA family ATPase [Clostridium lacusfryxellense]MBU3114507.1 AAA family ATPase [Clostridium lacusfryxellense]